MNSTDFERPSRLPGDWFQLIYNMVCCAVGLPINIVTLCILLARYKKKRSRLLLLHLNVNLSDLCILVFYSLGRIVWYLSWEWPAGITSCVLMRYLEQFSFTFSSNIVVVIAVERLYTLHNPLMAPYFSLTHVPQLIVGSYILALLTSAPQLFVWTIYTPDAGDFTQCVDIWTAMGLRTGEKESLAHSRDIYIIYSTVVLFWIPATVIIVSYAFILFLLYKRVLYDKAVEAAKRNDMRRIADRVRAESEHEELRTTSSGGSLRGKRTARRTRSNTSIRARYDRLLSKAMLPAYHEERLRVAAGNDSIARRRSRAMRITLGLGAIYILCWTPYNITVVWTVVNPTSYEAHEDVANAIHCLVVFTAVVNPFIYGRRLACNR